MTTPLRLLIVEDSPSDAELVLAALRNAGYEPSAARVETEREFVEHLQPAPEIILADFTMPQFDSVRALEIIQERGLDIPFIIVSGTIGEERAVQVMQLGASDYVIKDRLSRLGTAVKQALERRRLNEAKLKAEQMVARLAAIVETSDDAIIATTLDGIITSWNAAAERTFGYSAEESLGKDVSLLFPRGRRQLDVPEDYPAILSRLRLGEHIQAFETVRVCRNGQRIEVLLNISPMRDAHGVVDGASTIALDITVRKRTERFLAARQAVTRALTESKNLQEAASRVLRCIAEGLRWEVAALWMVDKTANVLRRTHLWHSSWANADFINALSQWTVLERDMGVAGRTWSSGKPICERGIRINNQAAAPATMTPEGLRCGFGLPMSRGTEMLGVIEFYNPELRELGTELLAALDDIAREISQFCERCQTEKSLRASEEQFRHLADAMPQIVWTARADGMMDYCNERYYQTTGCPRDQPPEDTWRSILHPDDRQRIKDEWAQSVRTGAPYVTESRIIDRAANLYRWHLVRAFASIDLADATRWYGTCTDIDEQKRSIEELRLGEERFRSLVMALPAAVYTTDQKGFITLFNEHAVTLWGQRPELGKSRWCGAWKLFRPDGSPLPLDQCPMAIAVNEGRSIRGVEVIVERPDGSRAFVLVHPEPIRSPTGEIIGAVNMVVDVTLMKQLEEQYRQSQKMEAIGQLAAGIAHDFNNLLTVILGYSDFLLMKLPAADPSHDMLSQIRKAGEAAAALTRQLLAFGRKQLLAPVTLDLNALFSELEKMLRRLFGADIEMITVLERDLGFVRVDPGQIEQVIINLVVNARDAMPTGGRLTILTSNTVLSAAQTLEHKELPAGPYTMLVVSDTGIGMDEATKARVFEPFFTTKAVGKGTGLGLATVFGIVKQSGGFIEVDSTLGSGCTFRIFFPQVEESFPRTLSDPSAAKMPRGTETILLVDDNDELRHLGKIILETSGYKVLCAPNGREAMRLCLEYADTIHMLLSDVVMPKMSGRQLADLLQSERPGVKVLYMSGYTDDTMVRNGIEDAQSFFLSKPFTPTTLAQKVREVLDRGSGAMKKAIIPGNQQ